MKNSKKVSQNENRLEVMQQQQIHQGPLPMAIEFAEYDRILPGSAERILKMAENQAAHRQSLEASVVKTQNRNSTIGLFSAFVLCLITILLGGYGAYNGGGWQSAIFGTSGIGALAGVFIYGTKRNK